MADGLAEIVNFEDLFEAQADAQAEPTIVDVSGDNAYEVYLQLMYAAQDIYKEPVMLFTAGHIEKLAKADLIRPEEMFHARGSEEVMGKDTDASHDLAILPPRFLLARAKTYPQKRVLAKFTEEQLRSINLLSEAKIMAHKQARLEKEGDSSLLEKFRLERMKTGSCIRVLAGRQLSAATQIYETLPKVFPSFRLGIEAFRRDLRNVFSTGQLITAGGPPIVNPSTPK